MQKLSSLIICFAVLGCASRPDSAPIENATNIPSYMLPAPKAAAPAPAPVADAPSQSSMGSLSDSSVKPISPPPSRKATPAPQKAADTTTIAPGSGEGGWMIPTAGKTEGYQAGTKGVDIYGSEGQAIYATNSGKVVYSGNGLKGYGNLIIIKHDETYLTAYAHNKTNLVKEGSTVKRGQKIAEMGTDDSGKAVLHFELRKNGKPIDPFILIKN